MKHFSVKSIQENCTKNKDLNKFQRHFKDLSNFMQKKTLRTELYILVKTIIKLQYKNICKIPREVINVKVLQLV